MSSTVSFKHLESKLKFAELSISQWLLLALGAGFALFYVSEIQPISLSFSIVTGIFIAGIPVMAQFAAAAQGISLMFELRNRVRWYRAPARYTPGPGAPTKGYVVRPDPVVVSIEDADGATAIDMGALWD